MTRVPSHQLLSYWVADFLSLLRNVLVVIFRYGKKFYIQLHSLRLIWFSHRLRWFNQRVMNKGTWETLCTFDSNYRVFCYSVALTSRSVFILGGSSIISVLERMHSFLVINIRKRIPTLDPYNALSSFRGDDNHHRYHVIVYVLLLCGQLFHIFDD